jgi:hypothetical protein
MDPKGFMVHPTFQATAQERFYPNAVKAELKRRL